MLVQRIDLNIASDTEQTEITMTWAGGFTSHHLSKRTVISYSQRSDLDQLIARIVQLKQTGLTLKQAAQQLNQARIASLRGRPFTNSMLSRLLVQRGLYLPDGRKRPESVVLSLHELWLPDLADRLQMPRTTLNHWHDLGWIHGRKLADRRGRLILWADDAELDDQLTNLAGLALATFRIRLFLSRLCITAPAVERARRNNRDQFLDRLAECFAELNQPTPFARFRMNLTWGPSSQNPVLLFEVFYELGQFTICGRGNQSEKWMEEFGHFGIRTTR